MPQNDYFLLNILGKEIRPIQLRMKSGKNGFVEGRFEWGCLYTLSKDNINVSITTNMNCTYF